VSGVVAPGGESVKLLFGTRNPGKLRELRALVGSRFEVVSLQDLGPVPEVEETGETFEANAEAKALAYARSTGLATLADDSGLCVDALGGRPGVHSARYAPGSDANRVEKLLREMRAVSEGRRAAVFRCALCLALPTGWQVLESAECRGEIAREPRGENGFGYEPVFLVPELGRTMAELSADEKGQISHRARAMARMRPHLQLLAAGAAR
jgi:XTP/dITP diphosphohydrolase